MKRNRYILMAITLALAIASGAYIGNEYHAYINLKMEATYITSCEAYAAPFGMRVRYTKTKNGMPLAYFSFISYETTLEKVERLNYVVNNGESWIRIPFSFINPSELVTAKEKLYELFGGEVTINDVLERSKDVQDLLSEIPPDVITHIFHDY